MTRRWLVALFSFVVLYVAVPAGVQAQDVAADIQEAFGQGDADGLLRHAASRIEVMLLGNRTFYSKAQAQYVLRDFFRDYPPERFTLQDTSKREGSWFVRGVYRSRATAQPMRVYVRLRQEDGRWEVRELFVRKG